jgi:hypothetical protein
MPDFSQALMLGTARLSGMPDAPHAALAEAWNALPWTDAPETALLDAAALLGTARAAGRAVPSAPPAPGRAAPEIRPPAGAAAVALLPRLLTPEYRPLLGEWLELCHAHGHVIPPFFLPRLLDTAQPAERAAVAAVAGERGLWLAGLNLEWAWLPAAGRAAAIAAAIAASTPAAAAPATAAVTGDLALWETGTPPERLACLARWRVTAPATGRERLRQTWPDETPDFRHQALALLATGLSQEDESFLTPLLTDRRKDIRQQAQALLVGLPGSALAGRLRQRAQGWLTLKRGLLSKKLELALPAAFEPDWKKDALEEKPPAGVGEKAFWVQQVLACVPVRHWTETFALPVGTLFKFALDSEWAELLIRSWLRSAMLHRDADAAAALLPIVAANPKCLPSGLALSQALVSLLALCDDPVRWQLLAKHGGDHGLAWAWLREIATPPPDPALARSRVLLALLAPALRDGANPGGSPQAVLAARWIAPELRPRAEALVRRETGLSKPAEAFLQALELRATLHTAFPKEPTSQPSSP